MYNLFKDSLSVKSFQNHHQIIGGQLIMGFIHLNLLIERGKQRKCLLPKMTFLWRDPDVMNNFKFQGACLKCGVWLVDM